MKSAKIIVTGVVVFILVVITVLVMILSYRIDFIRYENDMIKYITPAAADDAAYAEYNGTKTLLSVNNCEKIRAILTVSERKKLYFKPDISNCEDVVVLTFGDELSITVAADPLEEDLVYVIYEGNKTRYMSIKGYNTMHWLTIAVSVEGYDGPNYKLHGIEVNNNA